MSNLAHAEKYFYGTTNGHGIPSCQPWNKRLTY